MKETKEMYPSWCDDHGVRLGNVKIKDLHDFKEHPFHVVEDMALFELVKSIEDKGVIVPLIVRVNTYGEGYEIPVPKLSQEKCEDEREMENRLNEVESKTEEMEEVTTITQSEISIEDEKDKAVVIPALLEENHIAELSVMPEIYQEIGESCIVENEMEDDDFMTKQKYEALSDEEKMKWIEIDLEDVYGSMKKFQTRMEELGIRFDTIGEYTDEYMRLCDVAKKQSGYWKEYYHERGERRR